jgi:hypothetical protein
LEEVISPIASIASTSAATYVSMSQSRCFGVGLRQLATKTWKPFATRCSTMLLPGDRSNA